MTTLVPKEVRITNRGNWPGGSKFVSGLMKVSGTYSAFSAAGPSLNGIGIHASIFGLQDIQVLWVGTGHNISSGADEGTWVVFDEQQYSTTGSIKYHMHIRLYDSDVSSGGESDDVDLHTYQPLITFFAIGNPEES